jgi:hypothetical protein
MRRAVALAPIETGKDETMKTAIFAALVAFATSSAVIAPVPAAQAASITITPRDDGVRYDNGRHLGWWNGKHRGY